MMPHGDGVEGGAGRGGVGFDAVRLERIARHFARYVAKGQLPGWLIVVARGGHIAYVATEGMRDREAGSPVTEDTL